MNKHNASPLDRWMISVVENNPELAGQYPTETLIKDDDISDDEHKQHIARAFRVLMMAYDVDISK